MGIMNLNFGSFVTGSISSTVPGNEAAEYTDMAGVPEDKE